MSFRECPGENIQAFQLFHRAAVGGYAKAQYLVFQCHRDGHGVAEDIPLGMGWLAKSANSGFAQAEWAFGCRCFGGQDVPQNEVEAIQWLRKAAERGYAPAQYELALCYSEVRYSEKRCAWSRLDQLRASALQRRDQNPPVLQNDAEAAMWYRKAAEQDYTPAQRVLSRCYKTGKGVLTEHSKTASHMAEGC